MRIVNKSISKLRVSIVLDELNYALKVIRSQNKIVEAYLFPNKEQTNLFFYPVDSEILDT